MDSRYSELPLSVNRGPSSRGDLIVVGFESHYVLSIFDEKYIRSVCRPWKLYSSRVTLRKLSSSPAWVDRKRSTSWLPTTSSRSTGGRNRKSWRISSDSIRKDGLWIRWPTSTTHAHRCESQNCAITIISCHSYWEIPSTVWGYSFLRLANIHSVYTNLLSSLLRLSLFERRQGKFLGAVRSTNKHHQASW